MSSRLRRYLSLLLLVALVPLGFQAAIWISETLENRRGEPPVRTVRAFLDAFRNGDCARALTFLSAASRKAVEVQIQAQRQGYERSTPRSCWIAATRVFHGLQSKSARVSSQAGTRSFVSVERREADPTSFLMPGFWPTRYFVTQAEISVMQEEGEWRIVLP